MDRAIRVTLRPFVRVETVPPTVQVRLKVAVLVPADAGLAVITTVQLLALGRSVLPQLSVVIEKSPELAPPNVEAEHRMADDVPVFDKVKVWLEVILPTLMEPKLCVRGLQAK